MLICGANDVIGVGQYGYTAVYSGAGVLQAVFGYCSGTGTAGTGLQVLVLLVLSVYTAVLLATCIHLTSYPPSREGVDVVSVVEVASGAWLPMSRSFRDDVPPRMVSTTVG